MNSFISEDYGHYTIRSGPLGGRWGANGYRRKLLIAKAVGDSRESAIVALKTELDQLDAVELNERDDQGVPSATAYERAFLAIEPITDSYRAMLRAHLAAADHLISATMLAKAAGYENWSAANLHYGTLGRSLAEELSYDPPKRDDGSSVWTYTLATEPSDSDISVARLIASVERNDGHAHFEWQLRPQVVVALQKLGY